MSAESTEHAISAEAPDQDQLQDTAVQEDGSQEAGNEASDAAAGSGKGSTASRLE